MTILDAGFNNYFRAGFHSFHSKTKEAGRGIIIESRRFLVRERNEAAEKEGEKRNKRKLLTGYSSRKREKARTSRSQIGGELLGREEEKNMATIAESRQLRREG